jgi:ribosomal subunit interface protein
MQIEIQARGFTLTQALRGYIERRLSFALSARYADINRLRVRLSDINGPRGGNDKRCQVQVMLTGQTPVVIEDTQSDLYVAIDRASDRARRTLTRRLGRQLDKDRVVSLSDRWLSRDDEYARSSS